MTSNHQSQAVLVLGMHRSGTSAFTAGLSQIFGISLGNVLTQTSHANKKGYFENPATWKINNKLLAALGSSWDAYAGHTNTQAAVEAHPGFRSEVLSYLQNNFCGDRIFAIKDPRITILLPFWESALATFDADIRRIIVIRHPLEVAFSQQARYKRSFYKQVHACGCDLRYVLNLWFWYNLCLLSDLPDDRNLVIAFSRLMSDPVEQIQRVGRFLDMMPDPAAMSTYAESFLDKRLTRQDVTPETMESFSADYHYVFDLYDKLTDYASGASFLRDDAKSLLATMPDMHFLKNWTAPIHAKTAQQLRYVEKYWLVPKILWKFKKLFRDIHKVKT